MDFAKRYPILTAVLALCVAAFAVELFFLWKFSKKVTVAHAQLVSAQSSAKSAQSQTPAPSDENLTTATKNVEDLKAELAEVDNTLQNTPLKLEYVAPTAGDPGGELVNQIEGFKKDMNDKAQAKGILLPSGDYNYGFGLSLYEGRGVTPPPADKIATVYKQMKVLEYILTHLMEDAKLPEQKMKIVSVAREDVTAVAPAGGTPQPSIYTPVEGGSISDFFTITPVVSARVPGAINTLAFRIQFISYTESLRILLSDLAKFELPLVVRDIIVEPAAPDRALTGAPAKTFGAAATADTGARKPVITDNFSQFTIVVEYIELPAPPKPATPDAADAGAAPAEAAATGTAK